MYTWDDILIVGDSWCSSRSSYDHWPKLLYSELTNDDLREPRGRGYKGCSWWSTRKRLLAEFNKHIPKILILCHTDYSRIPNDDDIPINISSAYKKSKRIQYSIDNMIYKSAANYYSYIYSKYFHFWAERQWYDELDYILQQHNIEKIIHLFGFSPEGKIHKFKIGLTIKDPLVRYFNQDINSLYHHNHMTAENNQKLAFKLLDILNNYPGNGVIYENQIMDGGRNARIF